MSGAEGRRPDDASPGPAPAGKFALSVDVEDYFQVWAFSSVVAREDWDDYAPRVDMTTRRVLDLFDRHGVKATFFMLGWVCERAPGLARDIVARGHELASHGYDHTKVFDQTPAEFAADIRRAKAVLEDAAATRIVGYRAPGFSIDSRTPWAYEALAAAGYRYSSSAHPIAHDHYGDPNGRRDMFAPLPCADFLEIPAATAEMFGRRVSAAGGGWFRAAPYGVSKRLIARAAATLTGPVVFYFHPWELDADQPRVAGAPLKSRVRHYLNLGATEGKLVRLIDDFAWGRIDAAIAGARRAEAA